MFEHDKDEFPEGGYGYFVVFAEWLIMACSFGMINSFGVYQTYYTEQAYTNESVFRISLIGSLQVFCIYFFSILTVTLMHYLGPQMTVAIGIIIQVFGYMMVSITNAIWQLFLAQGLVIGFGASLIYSPGMIVLLQYFKKKRAFALGFSSAGSCIAGVYFPIAIRRLINEVGFGWTNRIIGFIYLAAGTVMVAGMRPRLSLKYDAEKYGKGNLLMVHFDVLRDWKFIVLIFGNFLGFFGLFPGLFYTDLYAYRLQQKLNSTFLEPQYYLSILNASSAFGRILPAVAGDYWGRMNMLFPFLTLAGVFPFALWIPSSESTGVFLAFCVTWGFCSGVFISLYPALVTQLHGIEHNQSRMSLFFTIGSIPALFGPIICGSFVPQSKGSGSSTEGFDKVAIFTGVMLLASAAVELALRLVHTRKLTSRI